MVTKAIERAQKKVEERNFEIRKHLLEYDDVNNKQRTVIYKMRRSVLEGEDQRDWLMEKARGLMEELVDEHLAGPNPAEWDVEALKNQLRHYYGLDLEESGIEVRDTDREELDGQLWQRLDARYSDKEERLTPELMRQYERHILMQIIDSLWKDHLLAMDHLKEGIGLRAYGQKDPLIEYKKESFAMFEQMNVAIENDAVRFLFLAEPMTEQERQAAEDKRRREQQQIFEAASRAKAGVAAKGGVAQQQRKTAKVGRNDPCPCGSGKKFKKCHGQGAA